MENEKTLRLLSDYEDAGDEYAVHRVTGCDSCQNDERAQLRHDHQLLARLRGLRAQVLDAMTVG